MRRQEVYNIREHRIRYFFDELWDAKWALCKLIGRLALIGFIGNASYNYLFKNGDTQKSSLKNKIAQLENVPLVREFNHNWQQSKAFVTEIVQEHKYMNSPEGKQHAAQVRKIRAEREKDMDEMFGKDEWRMKYVKPGDPEYAQAAKDFRDLMNDRIR